MSLTTVLEEQPPPFEEAIRRTSILPPTFESAQNQQLEQLGDDDLRRVSAPTAVNNEEEEEELPGYDDVDAPAPLPNYEERHLLDPVVSYTLYQITRKLQILTPSSRVTFDRPRYRLTSRSVFSKKADITLTRLPTGAAAAAETCPGKDIGFVNFDKAGTIPWMPRARVDIVQDAGDLNSSSRNSFALFAPNFSDWKITIDAQDYFWRLTGKPTALSLIESSSQSVLARFAYSRHGTDATRGAEVGVLEIFGGSRSEEQCMIELMMASCQVPLVHWKNMGRHYNNASPTVPLRSRSVGSALESGIGNAGMFGPWGGPIG